jgi:RNA polymerase sigma-70 factor (ECF subfamily)
MMAADHTGSMLGETDLNDLFQYAFTLCRHRQDAYDLLQSGVEKYLIEVKRGGKTIDNPPGFVRTVIRHRYIDQYRRDQRWPSDSFEESASYDISPVDLEQACIDEQHLHRIWDSLSPIDRDILYHWAVLGYSTDEACAELGMARGTFLSRIHRLRKNLQIDQHPRATGEAEP